MFTTNDLEHAGEEAMYLENVAVHFAQIVALSEKNSMAKLRHIFNLEESGFSIWDDVG